MFSLNRVHLIGYQTQPVQLRTTPGGASVTDLNLVVPYAFTSEGGQELNGRSFHTITVWGALADIAGQFIKPGGQLFIAGRLQTDSWEDEQSGEKRSKTKIVALDMIMLDPKGGQMATPANAKRTLSACNRADIIGNVTRDPEMRTTTSGQKVVTLGVATNDRWRDKASGENKERSEFHNIVVWGDLAQEASDCIKKGQRVFVSGRVQTRSWETQNGAKRYTTEIIAEHLSLLGVRNPTADESIENSGRPQPAPAADVNFDQSAPEAAVGQSAPSQEPAFAQVPDINYGSEIKVEDLPF